MEERTATATVVARRAPISSHLGDRALVHADGRMEGFIGGACSHEIIRRQALAAMRTGRPRLVRIRPDALVALDEGEVVTVPMTCVSEGAVDVFIEPRLPKRRLLVAGVTPVSQALAKLGEALDFEIVSFAGEAELQRAPGVLDDLDPQVRSASAAVAASQGHCDEAALRVFLRYDLRFVGLLASSKRAASVLHLLAGEGVPEERLARVHAPVGLAIGAKTPAEVAVSILAEIVAAAPPEPEEAEPEAAPAQLETDPVCGMEVEVTDAAHRAEFEGRTYFFCCPHCRASFVKDPRQFLAAPSAT